MTSIDASRLIEQAKQKKAEQVSQEVSKEVQQKQSSAGPASSSSVFEQEKAGSNGQQVSSYDDWTESLNARGIKTTKLGANEANFANYAAALSDDLKNDILNSFDCEADYKLQAQIAGIFSGTNVVQSGDIISACKKLGIDVSVEYTKTSYIVDNKKGGQYANNKTNAINGSIAVYTFSDGNGGEIKIADANGNGALETEEIFKECMKDYFLPPEALAVNPMIIQSPLPGGALTANTQMMRDNGVMDKYPQVVAAMKEVVEKGGFATSVTPVSQFYFQQAFNNVMFGSWKKIADGYGKMVLGYFGKTPCEPDSEIIKIAEEQLGLQPTTELVVDLNDKDPNKGIAAATKMLQDAGLEINDENIFIAGACKEKGIMFLQGKGQVGVRKNCPTQTCAPATGNGSEYTVSVNGKSYAIKLDGAKASVNGKSYEISVKEGIDKKSVASSGAGEEIKAGVPGNVLKIEATEGSSVQEGDVIMVLEAMKMEIEVKSTKTGTVQSILVAQGDKVVTGQALAIVG